MMIRVEKSREYIFKDLLNRAMSYGLGVECVHIDSHLKPCLSYKRKLIILNMNYHNQRLVIFQLAHEIGHFLNGDSFGNEIFFSPAMNGFEGRANKTAVKLLLPYYLNDLPERYASTADFMNYFSIPLSVEKVVTEQIQDFYKSSETQI